MKPAAVPLSRLIRSLPDRRHYNGDDRSIKGISADSRTVKRGFLFVACPGEHADGHRYIPQAIANGASAVVGTQAVEGLAVPYFRVADSRLTLAQLAAALHGFPARQLVIIGVTGTDGKTTTASLVYQVLLAAGLRPGLVSTVSARIGERDLDTGFHVTTPDAPEVQAFLAQMVEAGLTHAILEATSHGLAQQRVAACDFDIGVVTNITHEHLDYHGTYENYRAAKGRLFVGLAHSAAKAFNPPRAGVLNRDDVSYEYLEEITQVRQVNYGLGELADVRAYQIQEIADGMEFRATGKDMNGSPFDFPIRTHLAGRYNVSNCLAAAAVGMSVLGLEPDAVQEGISALAGIPGRMERIEMGQDFSAIVDFAHTPNALKNALEAARSMTEGRVIAVFGSAGLRDREKRRLMAEVSAGLADLTVLTAEDPRTESLAGILEEMATAMVRREGVEGKTFWRVGDRREALRFAVSLASPGDMVITCGKGHEQSMCFGETEYPWDDRTALRAALAEMLGVEGVAMPYLPEA